MPVPCGPSGTKRRNTLGRTLAIQKDIGYFCPFPGVVVWRAADDAMIYSVACEYGIRALTKLAASVPPGRFCLLRDIVDGADLPQHFVGKILQTLVRQEILTSAKGRGGGFALQRRPEDISLRNIVEAIDGSARDKRCFLGLDVCDDQNPCPVHSRCRQMHKQVDDLLDDTTLAQLTRVMRDRASSRRARRR